MAAAATIAVAVISTHATVAGTAGTSAAGKSTAVAAILTGLAFSTRRLAAENTAGFRRSAANQYKQ
jgi:hypothetical protein